jgi:hypothetical protein
VYEVDVPVGDNLGIGNIHLDDRPRRGAAPAPAVGDAGLADQDLDAVGALATLTRQDRQSVHKCAAGQIGNCSGHGSSAI